MVKPTLRNISLNVMQCVVEFAGITQHNRTIIPRNTWQERLQHIRTLCLVSKAFWALAMPLLYENIVADCMANWFSLAQLVYALNNSAVNPLTFSTTPEGYGTHTKYFTLLIDRDLSHDLRPAELGDALCMMKNLQAALICRWWPSSGFIQGHWLETRFRCLVYDGGDPSHILKQHWISRAMPFLQALRIPNCNRPCEQSGALFIPDLQELHMSDALCSVVTSWAIPNLKHLDIRFGVGYEPLDLTNLLRKKGRQLWSLSLGPDFDEGPEISEILSLCTNLLTFEVLSNGEFSQSSFTSHTKLAVIYRGVSWGNALFTRKTADRVLEQVERFISTWKLRFPNLRVANFQEDDLIVKFYTNNDFYTVAYGDTNAGFTYMRWEGTWIGGGEYSCLLCDRGDRPFLSFLLICSRAAIFILRGEK
jgi:hypothetical protein